jgi:hypothetical protein
MVTSSAKVKRYNLGLPEDLYEALQEAANERHTTVVALLRSFVKLGLIALELEKTPDAALLIKEGDKEQRIMLL